VPQGRSSAGRTVPVEPDAGHGTKKGDRLFPLGRSNGKPRSATLFLDLSLALATGCQSATEEG